MSILQVLSHVRDPEVGSTIQAQYEGDDIAVEFGNNCAWHALLRGPKDVAEFIGALADGSWQKLPTVFSESARDVRRVIAACKQAEQRNQDDTVLVQLIYRVRHDLEDEEYDGLEVSDINGSCLKAYYSAHGYEGDIWTDIIEKIEFCAR